MNTSLLIACVVLAALSLAALTGLAAYMRAINGQVPNAIASGIEAGIGSLKHGPLGLVPTLVPQLALPTIATGATTSEGGGHIAATVKPWYPASYIPAWNQLGTPLPDGAHDPQEFNDCGEACVSMIVAGVHGVPMDPGGVRQWLRGVAGSGLTSGDDLVAALAHYSTAAHVETPQGGAAWDTLSRVVATERPVIMLGRWQTPGNALHWEVAVYRVDDRMFYVNPWGGTRSWVFQADFLAQYAGQLVVLDSHIHYDCRGWPQPT